MSDPHPTSTADLVKALRTLARDIQSGDGVSNAAIAEAADRLEQLALYEEPLIRSMTVEGGRMSVTIDVAKGTVLHIADCMATILGDAKNYVEMDVIRADSEALTLHIQRKNGKTPHELRLEAEMLAERQRNAMDLAREYLLRIWPDGAKCNHDYAREAFRALEVVL